MVEFTPLASVEDGIYQGLITIEDSGAKVLVDVGWNPSLKSSLASVVDLVGQIDLILLTHATVSHIGAYCYLCKTNPEFANIPTFASIPVINMGKVLTYDTYRSRGISGPFEDRVVTANEIDEIFDNVRSIKYSQPLSLNVLGNPKLDDISITAYNSGHSLGGTMWKIGQNADSILYCVDWNHSRDIHLTGAFIESGGKVNEQLIKPSVMITSSTVSNGTSAKSNRENLLSDIKSTISRGGSVILPTSAGSRVLELILVIDKFLEDGSVNVPLLYVSHNGQRTLSYAPSMLEWMLSSIIDRWQVKNESPFNIDRIKFVSSVEELKSYGDAPKVVLTSDECLESGLSRQVLKLLGQNPENTVILTELCPPKSLGHVLHRLWAEQAGKSGGMVQVSQVLPSVELMKETPLEGEALAKYKRKEEEGRRERNLEQALEQRNKDILEQEDQDEFSSDDEDEQVVAGQMELGMFVYGEGVHDADLSEGDTTKVRMFPFVPRRVRKDEYGEPLRPGQFELNTPTASSTKRPSTDGERQSIRGDVVANGDNEDEEMQDYGTVTGNNWRIQSANVNETPLRLVKALGDIDLSCSIDYLDFNGLTDLRSIQMIVNQVHPASLIVLPGAASSALEALKIDTHDGSRPVTIQLINKSLSVKLSANLEETLQWQQLTGRFTVAHVSAQLEFEQADISTDNQSENREGSSNLKRSRDVFLLPVTGISSLSQTPILVGDIKLTELRARLAKSGHSAEFRGQGVLVCNNKVTVTKIGEGRFVIEGGLDPEFYAVRRAIKSFLATV